MMKEMFEIAAGSVIGSNHKWDERNNQDNFHYLVDERRVIAVVCDGCSEGKHSEVGAKIGSRILAEHILFYFTYAFYRTFIEKLEESRLATISELRDLATKMGRNNYSQLVNDYFLFTVIGVVMDEKTTMIFSIGDGVYSLNGETVRLGPFPNNEPPYLAYGGLVNSSIEDTNPELLKFQINETVLTDSVESVLIGTDGVANFIDAAESKLPGKEEKVGDISQFWLDDRYFLNRDMVRRRLFLANKEFVRPVWPEQRMIREKGLLPDDTTLVVIRRKER